MLPKYQVGSPPDPIPISGSVHVYVVILKMCVIAGIVADSDVHDGKDCCTTSSVRSQTGMSYPHPFN